MDKNEVQQEKDCGGYTPILWINFPSKRVRLLMCYSLIKKVRAKFPKLQERLERIESNLAHKIALGLGMDVEMFVEKAKELEI
ncbi:MAG: hypothetical protein FWE21_00060 [Defluviitaleaceae bacterium]|nr:hypothetical protein [Defluviitaleaceae bacterium]